MSRLLVFPKFRINLVSGGVPRLHPFDRSQRRYYAKKTIGPNFSAEGRPDFTASRAPTVEKVFENIKATSSSDSKQRREASSPLQGLRKYGIRPWILVLVPVLGYLGYRLYSWQTNPNRSLVLNGRYFTPFLLESKDQLSSTSSIFNLLSMPRGQNTDNIDEAWRLGVWSVQVMQVDLQIARSYTPLPPSDGSPAEQIRLLVRKEPGGEVSTYLHKQEPGFLIHVRGPYPEYMIPDDVDEVLFLAGGTGIAPALQVAHTLYTARGTPADRAPSMRILWANRRREDSYAGLKPSPAEKMRASIMDKVRAGFDLDELEKTLAKKHLKSEGVTSESMNERSLLIQEVEALQSKHQGKVKVDYFVDEENTLITEALVRDHLGGGSKSPQEGGQHHRKLLLISGPDGFVSFWAGPKGMKAGRETQGPIGGILENLDHRNWEVWKL